MSIFDPIYIDKETDTKLKSLVLNRLGKDRFDELSSHSPDEIWFIQDSELSGQPIVVDTRPPDIPTKLSEFENDVPYLSAVSWSQVTGKPTVPSTSNQLHNNSGYAQTSQCGIFRTWRELSSSTDPFMDIPVTIESAVEGQDCSFLIQRIGSPSTVTFQYSMDDGSTWTTVEIGSEINVPDGGKCQLRRVGVGRTAGSTSSYYNVQFVSGEAKMYGNLASMVNENFLTENTSRQTDEYMVCRLFTVADGKGLTPHLVDAGDLVIPWGYYRHYGCYELFTRQRVMERMPRFAAKTITTNNGNYAFQRAFQSCTAMKKHSPLPDINYTYGSDCAMGSYVFEGMFGLAGIEELIVPFSVVKSYCCAYMADQCPNLKRVSFPNLEYVASYGLKRVAAQCPQLKEASFPKLKYVENASTSFYYAFYGCSALCDITWGTADTIGGYEWVEGVSPTGTLRYSGVTSVDTSYILSGWRVVPA